MTGAVPAQAESLDQRASRYVQAWNDHDLEAICAMHTDNPVLRLGGAGGVQELTGPEAVREACTYLLQAWPDQRIETSRIVVAGDIVVADSVLTATLALPWEMGGEQFAPSTSPVTFALHDVLEFEGARIARKNTWIDGVAIRRQLVGSAAAPGAAG